MNRIRQTRPTVKHAALLASTLSTLALGGAGGVAQADEPIPVNLNQPRQTVPRSQGTTTKISDQDRRLAAPAQDTTPRTVDQDRRLAAPAQDTTPRNPDKVGRIMLNARGGVAMGVANADQDLRYMGALGIDFGVAVTRDHNAYVVLTPQLDVRGNFYNVMVPIGFQYDIRLVRGLYLYPRASIGYSAMLSHPSVNAGSLRLSDTLVTHGGVAIPEVGIKYVINGRFNLGVEPLSVPIFFNREGYGAWYRMMAFAGGNF